VRQATLVLLLVLFAAVAKAQTEISLTAGGYFPVNNPASPGNAFALEGSLAHSIASVPFVSLYLELPVAGSFESHVPSPSLSGAVTFVSNYTSLFVTPGLRLKLAPSFPLSPYFAVGGGYGRFNHKLSDGSTSATNNGVFDVGGGLDMKVAPFLSLRGEVRDFYSSGLSLLPLSTNDRQHNLFATAGIVVHF